MKKNVVVVGYGSQGRWHIEQIQKSDVVKLLGVWDIDKEQVIIAKSNNINFYSSLESVLEDGNCEIVVVATPNDTHRNIVVKSLLAGKNVMCEKPVDISLEGFNEMVLAAENNKRILAVHQNRRWDVDFLGMKKIIESGDVGQVIRVESRVFGNRGIPSDWRCKKSHGGGMLLDWGVHLIDQILQLVKEKVVTVLCEMTYITTKEVEDGFRMNLMFENGKSAYVEVGTFNFLPLPRFYLQCTEGTARIDNWLVGAHVSKMLAWSEKDVLPVRSGAGITRTMAPRDERTVREYDVERPNADVHDFYRNLCDTIDGKQELLVTNEEVYVVLKVVTAAFQSGKTGLPVRL